MLRICKRLQINSKLLIYRSTSSNMQRNDDNRLDTFRRVCDEIGDERSYLGKAKILQEFFKTGTGKDKKKGFQGDAVLWVQMLIPGSTQRVYNVQNKQMIKLFSRLFACDQEQMHLDVEQEGDVSETLRKFFLKSVKLKPQTESTLYLDEVEDYLKKLVERTKEDEQTDLFRQICKQCTELDLKIIIRLIKQDLRINARARHILDGLGPLAYPAYQASRDLPAVVRQFMGKDSTTKSPVSKAAAKKTANVGGIQVMTPISPMLANACKSVEEAFRKSPMGLFSEVKYDGERVQIHKQGNEFKFFSRNLKPVMDHKIKPFKEFIPKAFPGAGDMILDSEVILVDMKTGELLPFGSLGAHKKKEYANASVCLFVFDCILYDGDDLTNLSFKERRKILEENIKPIKSHVQLSECHFLKTKTELSVMTAKVLKANLEGVVLKNPTAPYQPGKRGWLKVKKDYLFGGKMADTADLVVLGAWFGSGKKGGVLSIFLMGCYDPDDRLWKTVTKVHSGLDDATHDEVHEQLLAKMERADPNNTPSWLLCKKALVPDYLAKRPDDMPVWEITGAEFTKSEAHTAAGISIRFPRITRLRDDKSAGQHNDLPYLQKMYEASKKDVNVDLLMANCDTADVNDEDDSGLCGDMDFKVNSKLSLQSPTKSIKSEKSVERKTPPTPKQAKSTKKRSLKIESDDDSVEVKDETSPKKRRSDNSEKQKILNEAGGRPQKQRTLDFFAITKAKAPSNVVDEKESNLFKNVVGYFVTDALAEKSQSTFLANGGRVAKASNEATMVFHESPDAPVDLQNFRRKYKMTCRHVSVDWLHDSLREKQCKPYPLYAVVLK